jgi:hypothetical protein
VSFAHLQIFPVDLWDLRPLCQPLLNAFHHCVSVPPGTMKRETGQCTHNQHLKKACVSAAPAVTQGTSSSMVLLLAVVNVQLRLLAVEQWCKPAGVLRLLAMPCQHMAAASRMGAQGHCSACTAFTLSCIAGAARKLPPLLAPQIHWLNCCTAATACCHLLLVASGACCCCCLPLLT